MKNRGSSRRCWWIPVVRSLTLLFLLLIVSVPPPMALAEGEAWLQLSPGRRPIRRQAASAVYDAGHQQMIVFGGLDVTGDSLNDVWSLNLTPLGESWRQLQPGPGPKARSEHTAVYDAANGSMVVFGGRERGGDFRGDVWVLTLTPGAENWIRLDIPAGPSGRIEHSAIYDAANSRMIVFGGVEIDGGLLNDVWALDLRPGSEGWTRLDVGSGPASRREHTAIYDAFNQRMVVFGGVLTDGSVTNDVWALDLRLGQETWVQLNAGSGPERRSEHVAVYEPLNRRMVVYGGLDSQNRPLDDVWYLNLQPGQERWRSVSAGIAPARRHQSAAIYDPRDHRLVVFGGLKTGGDLLGDTAVLNFVIDAPPRIRILSPEDGAAIDSSSIEVQVVIENFILDAYRVDRGPDREDFGHWHLLLDGAYQTFVLGTRGIEATLTNLSPGQHTIKVELANNQHSLLGIEDEVTVIIAPQRPGIRIISPVDDSNTYDRDITVQVEVENVILDPDVGGEPVAGHGHWHIRVDGVDLGVFVFTRSYTIADLTPGTHRITVEMHANDHFPFDPPVLDTAVIHILDPRIQILAPPDDALINSSSVEVRVEVQDFTLDPDRVGGPNAIGFGHWHLFLDGVYQGFVTGTEGFEATLTELSAGPHEIRVELANNDHTPLAFEGASDVVNITIAEGRPAIRIASPLIPRSDTATPWGKVVIVDSETLEVVVQVENFILDAEGIGGPPVPGHGHWHLYVDGDLQVQTAESSAVAKGLTWGRHRIVVTLTNNDHSELDPPVIDTFVVLRPFHTYLPLLGRR